MKLAGNKRMSIQQTVAIAACALALGAPPALAQPGSAREPIPVHMSRGSDVVKLTGVLRQNPRAPECCAYTFKAHAGQTLHWALKGPNVRIVLTYPDGHSEGPGVPNVVPLPADGAYVFSVSPNLMADNAFGRFVLTLRIPPR
jgi:hypothetical protein